MELMVQAGLTPKQVLTAATTKWRRVPEGEGPGYAGKVEVGGPDGAG